MTDRQLNVTGALASILSLVLSLYLLYSRQPIAAAVAGGALLLCLWVWCAFSVLRLKATVHLLDSRLARLRGKPIGTPYCRIASIEPIDGKKTVLEVRGEAGSDDWVILVWHFTGSGFNEPSKAKKVREGEWDALLQGFTPGQKNREMIALLCTEGNVNRVRNTIDRNRGMKDFSGLVGKIDKYILAASKSEPAPT